MFYKFLASALITLPLVTSAMAADWPPQNLTLVTHSSAGGGGDIMIRTLGQTLENAMGISTVSENRRGGSGAVALTWLANQAPKDGTVVMSVTPTQLITPLRAQGIPSFKEVTPIARLFIDPSTIYVHRDSPFQTMEALIAHLQQNQRSLSIGIGSAGSLDQLVYQNFAAAAGVQARLVPHEGGGDAVVALLGQHVDAVIGEPGQALTHLENQTLRMLAVFQEERLEAYPEVPTMKELGYTVISNKFRGVFGPPGMDPVLVEKIASQLGTLYAVEPWNTYWRDGSMNPAFMGPAQFTSYLESANEELGVFIESLK